MKNVLWLVVGIGAGFLAAHQVNRTEGGRAFFQELDARIQEFNAAVASGYRSRDSELRGAPDNDR
ncbi:hypothetical protein [Marisediminicola antarctica]|uniref:Uncharacterized protein n=1 Tax=Marisediminicola antarctica TaxID=674079 RepID=A0A7L5AIU3_9MICO|nr:hypothetical protein [Marisediminicola antarctica]QHO69982.1 hypothetical protein BHD05_10330 [Marisediminicola antarctica]